MPVENEQFRYRSFAERYVVERASSFTKGQETEEAWKAALDAKTIYEAINRISVAYAPKPSVDEQVPVFAGSAQPAKAAQSYMARQVAASAAQRGWRGVNSHIDHLVDHWEQAIMTNAPRHVIQDIQDMIENEIQKHQCLHSPQRPPRIGAVDSKGWTGYGDMAAARALTKAAKKRK